MVDFKLGDKLNNEDELLNNDTGMGQRKILSPRRESNP